jgi:uncharacterized phage protein (TIGR02218 family)
MSYAARETSIDSGEPIELYAFTTADGAWYFTSADQPVDYLEQTFAIETMHRTAITQSGEAKAGQIKVTVPLDNPVASQFMAYIPSTPMSLVIYRTHGSDGEFVVIFTGRVLTASFGDFAELTVMPENDLLKYNVPAQIFQTQCNHVLFDSGCKAPKTSFLVIGNVTALSSSPYVVTVPACALQPDGYFTNGYVEFGQVRRMVNFHVGNQLTLIGPVPGLALGDSITVYAGCMRDYGTCVSKFNNGQNFAGFQWIPNKNPFSSPFM